MLSRRDRVSSTGRPVMRVSSAAWAWTFRSSFAPKAPAVADLGPPHFFFGQREEGRALPPVVPGALPLGVDVHPTIFRGDRQSRFRLQEGVLDKLRLERLRGDV